MGRIGFWQLLLDDRMSYWEAQKINEAHEVAQQAVYAAESGAHGQQVLHERINSLSREVVMLRTAITVLVRTLKDTKVVDEGLLDARLDAAIEEATARDTAPVEPAKPAWDGLITCLRCRQRVPAASTVMTAEGPMCDRCPAPPTP